MACGRGMGAAVSRGEDPGGMGGSPGLNEWWGSFTVDLEPRMLGARPLGGFSLNPPLSGGLCDGVMTMPSASPAARPRLWRRIARETTGVGVTPSSAWIRVSMPLAANTSRAVRWAADERACVSLPMTRGPVTPTEARYSQ